MWVPAPLWASPTPTGERRLSGCPRQGERGLALSSGPRAGARPPHLGSLGPCKQTRSPRRCPGDLRPPHFLKAGGSNRETVGGSKPQGPACEDPFLAPSPTSTLQTPWPRALLKRLEPRSAGGQGLSGGTQGPAGAWGWGFRRQRWGPASGLGTWGGPRPRRALGHLAGSHRNQRCPSDGGSPGPPAEASVAPRAPHGGREGGAQGHPGSCRPRPGGRGGEPNAHKRSFRNLRGLSGV